MKTEEEKKLVGEDEFRLQETEGLKPVVTIDELIEDYVGSFGFPQLLHVFFVSLAWIFDSQNTLVTIFTDAQPEWRCKSPCANVTGHGRDESLCGLQPGSWEWIGGHASSTVAEWNLVCDRKFLAAIPASLFFLGSILGCALYGRLSDGFLGRKKTMLLSCILTSATAFITSLSPNVWIYAILRFANGFSRSGIGICSLVLSTEAVGRKWRGQVGQYGFFFFTAGFLSLPLIAHPNRTNWRNIHRILSVLPLFYSIVVLPFVSKSPRWLLIRGRNQDALDVLKKFARFNGKKLPDDISLSSTFPPGEPSVESKRKTLWGTKWAAARMIMMMIAGVGVGFVYYGIQLNVENLSFNLYYTVALNAMMEIPAVFVGGVLLSFTNRRLLFSSSSYIAGVACLICAVLAYGSGRGKDDGGIRSWSQLSIEAIGFMAASTAFDVSYIYCVELFPTNVRNFAVSMLRQSLMFGASIAPLLVVAGRMSPAFSFLVFGAISVCSGFLSLWLPETRNAPLYETIEHQEKEESLDPVSHVSEIQLS